MKRKRVLAAALTSAMLVGLLPQAALADDQVTLRFIDVSPSAQRQEYYENAFAKFEEETGIAVTYESVPWDDAADKLTVLGTSGQLPDVMTTHSLWLGQFTDAGWIIPLDDYVEENGDQFIDAVEKITGLLRGKDTDMFIRFRMDLW